MEPLDLSVRPPRSPYAQMHGIYMVPRTIDKIRAQLPGGNLGPRYLTSLSLPPEDYCLLIGEIPAGAIVPLHSHFDRETFYVLSGEMNFYDGASWQVLHQGRIR
jgi:mannose-6-phosphate isomerase-like protein (cupin superfamily)